MYLLVYVFKYHSGFKFFLIQCGKLITVITLFDIQIVPNWARDILCKPLTVLSLLSGTRCSGLTCTFPAHNLNQPFLQETLIIFGGKYFLETSIQVLDVLHKCVYTHIYTCIIFNYDFL